MAVYSVVDLFAGAGGLSLGFMQTGKFEIKAAFENNPNMQKTYHHNHPNVDLRGDICGEDADYDEIKEKHGNIDIVIGGPPCQGFSNANRQKNHAISQNNMLVKRYIQAVIELQPKAFVMENVSMLRSDVHRFYMSVDKEKLAGKHNMSVKTTELVLYDDEKLVEKYNIPVKTTELLLLEKDYVFDGALEIIKNKEQVETILWSEEQYAALNVVYKAADKAAEKPEKIEKALHKHKTKLLKYAEIYSVMSIDSHIAEQNQRAFNAVKDYFDGKIEVSNILPNITPAIMIQRMASKAKEIFDNHIVVDEYSAQGDIIAKIRSFAVYDYLTAILGAEENGYVIDSGVLCAADYGAPQKRKRFVIMGVKKEISSSVKLPTGTYKEKEYRKVRDAIEDLANIEPVTEITLKDGIPLPAVKLDGLAASLRDSEILYNHVITKTTETAMERFKALKQGQNFHALDESLKINTYTNAARTQNTIYLRLNYDEPCGTVVNVRKSMWIHPEEDRAISIREAARLQTFPDSFVFCGTKDQQYQQVGNAVPPIMAKAIAEQLINLLEQSEETASIN